MKIQYELPDSEIGVLFQSAIVIYGAGWDGIKMRWLFEMLRIKIECFVDKDPQKKIEGYLVIPIEKLSGRIKKKECVIILSSNMFYKQMFEDLSRNVDVKYVYTRTAVEDAILKNSENSLFPRKLRGKYLECFYSSDGYRKEKIETVLAADTNILLWSPPKVGSSTVQAALRKKGFEVIHVHTIGDVLEHSEIARNRFEKKRQLPVLKIICMVREPISRDLSHFMEFRDILMAQGIHDVSDYFLEEMQADYQFSFYDREIKKYLGIDIYKYPFDRVKGYSIIKSGNIEMLLLKLETLSSNGKILGDFMKIENLEMARVNEGNTKSYAQMYNNLKKEYRVPQKVLEFYYCNNKRMDHFYTEKEKNYFLENIRIKAIED